MHHRVAMSSTGYPCWSLVLHTRPFNGTQAFCFFGLFHASVGLQVLCASNAAHDQVDPLSPAQGTAVGDKVSVAGCALIQGYRVLPEMPSSACVWKALEEVPVVCSTASLQRLQEGMPTHDVRMAVKA